MSPNMRLDGMGSWGVLSTKGPRGCAANMGSKISLLVHEWPLLKWKIWFVFFFFFFLKILPNLSQNWLKFKKIWKTQVILLKISLKIGLMGIWMGHFFLKNWYLYESTFKFRSAVAHSYQNQTWVPPRMDRNPRGDASLPNFDTFALFVIFSHCSNFVSLTSLLLTKDLGWGGGNHALKVLKLLLIDLESLSVE